MIERKYFKEIQKQKITNKNSQLLLEAINE